MNRIRMFIMSKKINKDRMDKLEGMVASFLKKYHLTYSIPVDIFSLATKIGFDVRGAEFPENLEGLILVDESIDIIDGFKSNKVIAYNINKPIDDIKFIVAHELAHYIFAKETKGEDASKIVVAAKDHSDEYSENELEQEKDYIAAALLVPREKLKEEYSGKNVAYIKDDLANISEQYNVNTEIARRRIEEIFGE